MFTPEPSIQTVQRKQRPAKGEQDRGKPRLGAADSSQKTVDGGGLFSRENVINVLLAAIVGTLGALSFYYGVYTGFINPDNREKTLRYFSGPTWIKLHYTGMFCVLGGVVAAVFQAAQASTFAPIQAFVLGATWPSVVTRIMSGGAEATRSGRDLADAASNVIPRPTPNKTAADAEVII